MEAQPRSPHLYAIVLIGVLGALLVLSMQDESPTTDEPMHLTRGLAWHWAPDARLSYAHPPLSNALCALPIGWSERPIDFERLPGFSRADVERSAKGILTTRAYEARRAWFFSARLVVALMMIALAIYLYLWCCSIWSPRVALGALFFFALHPTLIAHGRLVTTDAPVTAAMFVAFAELVSWLMGRNRLHLLACVVFTGAALATKYTALALLPILGGTILYCAIAKKGRLARRWRFTRAALAIAAIGLGAVLAINAAYRFEATNLRVGEILARPEPLNAISAGFRGRMLESTPLASLPDDLRVPLPYTYVFGFFSVTVHDRMGHESTFFGRGNVRGNPAYFPVLLAIKTPLVMLLALAIAAFAAFKLRRAVRLPAWALAFFCAVLLALAMRAKLNIGVRHVLPMFPALCVLAGLGAARAIERWKSSPRHAVLFAALLAAHAAGMAWSFPDYLSDFNALVGGRAGGERVSIVGEEWGQDLVRLGRELRAREIREIVHGGDSITSRGELARFDVRIVHDIRCGPRPPRGRWVALNARTHARRRRCLPWMREREPAFMVGTHYFVYAPTE